jgi:hypothetical protein
MVLFLLFIERSCCTRQNEVEIPRLSSTFGGLCWVGEALYEGGLLQMERTSGWFFQEITKCVH